MFEPAPTARRTAALVLLLLATAAPAAAAAAAPEVGVRFGRHPGFDRLVFDWPEAVALAVEEKDGATRLVFTAAARFAPADLPRTSGGRILAAHPAEPVATATFVLERRAGTRLSWFKLADHRIVVDVGDGSAPAPRAPAASAARPPAPPPPAPAAAEPEGLQQELYRRDLMIASLLQRIERLERGMVLPPAPLDEVVAGGASPGAPLGIAPAAAAPPAAASAGGAPAEDPAEADAAAIERALERTLVQSGVLLLPFGQAEIDPGLAYSHGEQSAPVFVTSSGTADVFIGQDKVKRNEVTAAVDLRVGLPWDAQVELGLPYNYVDQDNTTDVGFSTSSASSGHGQGLGDLRIGAAKTLVREQGWIPDLVARGWWDTATGETRDNDIVIGSGFNELGAALSAVKRQDPLAFVGQANYEHAFEKNRIQPGDAYGFSLGVVLAASPETSLRAGFNQRFRDDTRFEGDNVAGSDVTIAMLNFGVSTLLGPRALLDLGVDIGVTDDSPDYVVRVSLPVRFNLPRL